MQYIQYDTLATSFVVLLAACAAFAVIWGAVKAVREIRRPSLELKAMVDEHERKLLHDHERLDDLKHATDLQTKALIQLINHQIDGNDSAKLVAVRDELQNYLINR